VITRDPVVVYESVHVAVSVAVPERDWAVQPVIAVPPLRNWTVPVGLPVAGDVAVTVAV
jgi:hypothetical protein